MKRVMLVVAYEGTNYHGWQIQPKEITVEQVLNEALQKLTKEDIQVIGASRTDAGVHALGNVAVFDTNSKIPGEKFSYALNQRLPEDIVIQDSKEVPMDFHPRYETCRKTYEYTILNRKFPLPQYRNTAHFYYGKLDVEKMQQATKAFIGTHDFAGFCSAGAQVKTTVRTIYSLEVTRQSEMICIRVQGDGFLYNMVRIIAGTLLEVGKGNIDPECMESIVASADRSKSGPTAPARGLKLVEIRYDSLQAEKEPEVTEQPECYKFFEHKKCEYYPCHKLGSNEEFNCLFCYCPLYEKSNCPGTPRYFVGSDGSKIKDCSDCLYPHNRKNYDAIMKALGAKEDILVVPVQCLEQGIWKQVESMGHFEDMDEETLQEHRKTAKWIYEQIFKKRTVSVLIKDFDASCIEQRTFHFGEQIIPCNALEKIQEGGIVKGYIYSFHAPEMDPRAQELSVLSQLYFEYFQIAIMDEMRDYISQYLKRKHSVNTENYVTDSFGPGFYGMGMESVKTLGELIPLSKVGVEIGENGILRPAKSILGIYVVTQKDVLPLIKDCASCVGNPQGCSFCRRGR